MVPKTRKRASVLAERIAEGKADPISMEERQIVAGLRADFEKRYGTILVPKRKPQQPRKTRLSAAK